MSEITEQQEVRVRVEDDTAGIYVGPEAIEAIRAEANRQADRCLREAIELWDDLDVSSMDEVKDVKFKLGMAQEALTTLFHLAPLPDDED